MVYLDGRAMYPKRISDTLGYDLAHGPDSEQTLYDQTTEYLRLIYNKAKMLNRTAARLAMWALGNIGPDARKAIPAIRRLPRAAIGGLATWPGRRCSRLTRPARANINRG